MTSPTPETGARVAARPRPFAALGWALSAAVCAGGAWGVVLLAAYEWLDISLRPDDLPQGAVTFATYFGAAGEGSGAILGAVVGFVRGRERRFASGLVLGFGGAMVGAAGGVLSVLAVSGAGPHVHPVAASSSVWALVGFAAGLGGYFWWRATAERDEPPDEDEEPQEGEKVEWVLREEARPWRERPLARVLPVLLVALAAIAGAAALAPSEAALALLAVGALGLSVAWVLHGQERRLRAIERRFAKRRE